MKLSNGTEVIGLVWKRGGTANSTVLALLYLAFPMS